MLQGNKTVCHLEHWNILLKWMQFSFLENCSLVPRKFQVVENHCSNISCAKSSISTPFLQSSKFAQRFTLQASLSGVSADVEQYGHLYQTRKKSCWWNHQPWLKKLRHQCIPTNKQWWFRRIVSKNSASSPFTVFTMAMVKVCILSSVSLCIRGSRTKWIGAGIEHGAQISSFLEFSA